MARHDGSTIHGSATPRQVDPDHSDARLKRDHDYLKAALDCEPDPRIVVVPMRGRSGEITDLSVDDANPAAEAYFGLDAHGLTGVPLAQVFDSAAAEALGKACIKTLESGEPLHIDEFQLGPPPGDGQLRYHDVRGNRVDDTVNVWWHDVTDRTALRLRLEESESRLRGAMESSLDWQVFLESVRDEAGKIVDLRIIDLNRTAVEHLGLPYDHLLGHGLRELFGQALDERWWARLVRVVQTQEPLWNPLVLVDSAISGPGRWFEERAVPLGDGLAFSWRDITDAYEATQSELRLANERYRFMVDNSADVVFHTRSGVVQWVSPASREVLGLQPDELVGRSTVQYWHEDDRNAAIALRDSVYSGHEGRATLRWRRGDADYVWLEAIMRPVAESDGSPGAVGTLRDVTDRVEAQQQIARFTRHDAQTGLTTRAVLAERLSGLLAASPSSRSRSLAVLCVGADGLSDINSAYGHDVGNIALAAVAGRVVETVGNADVVARGTGIDMLVLLEEPDLSLVVQMAERIRRDIKRNLVVGGHDLRLTASIGIAICEPRCKAEDVLQDSYLAMRRAKDLGRDRVEFSDPDFRQRVQRRVEILEQAHEALATGHIKPWYMPIADLATASVLGHEALARWQADSGDWLPAASFIGELEASPVIRDLDLAVLTQSLQVLTQLPAHQFMSVNVSSSTLSDPHCPTRMVEIIRDAHVDPSRLHLELTETSLLGLSHEVQSSVRSLADAGVKWYVDDFGTGFSSISHLRDLPIAGLKLDKSFTADLGRGEEKSIRLAQALAGMAQGLGLDTVAEGVEEKHEAEILAAQGWRHGQGWLYGKAAPDPC